MKSKLGNIAGVVLGLAALGGWWVTRGNVNTYNDYAETLRPVMAESDAFVTEITKVKDKEGAKLIDQYIERSKALEAKFVDVTPEDEEIAALHQHIIARSKSVTAWLEGIKVYYGSKSPKDLAAANEHAKQGKAHLDAFVAARNAYGKKKDIKFEDQ